MIGSVSTNRRAHAFAQALDEQEFDEGAAADRTTEEGRPEEGLPAQRTSAETGCEQPRLLAVAEGLAAVPGPTLDPDVKTVQRAQLIAAMETAFAEGGSNADDGSHHREHRSTRSGRGTHRAHGLGPLGGLRPTSRLGKGLAAGGLSVGVAATALGGVAAASTDALPGDTLYGLKRGMEDVRIDLAGDDADRGRIHLDHASTRLRETRRLMERQRAGDLDDESLGEIRRALSGMKHDAGEGHRLLSAAYERDGRIGRMETLSRFSEHHRSAWVRLRDQLPVQLSEVSQGVSSVFDAMEEDIDPLRSLFPSSPEEDPGEDGRPGTGDATGSGESPDPESSRPSADSSEGGPQDGSGRPHPSGSEEDGLLGGSGILEPSTGASEGRSGSDGSRESGGPEPDITLPPLVPDVLPGLGIDSEDGD